MRLDEIMPNRKKEVKPNLKLKNKSEKSKYTPEQQKAGEEAIVLLRSLNKRLEDIIRRNGYK